LDGEEFDFCPIVQLRDSIFQERSEANDVAMQGGQAALLDRVELAFWDNKTDLEIIAPVEENEQFPVAKKAKRLWRGGFPLWKSQSEGMERAPQFIPPGISFCFGQRMEIRGDYCYVRPQFMLALRIFHPKARHHIPFSK